MRFVVILLLAASAACGQPSRQYPLQGQILAIGQPRSDGLREMTVRHADIPGFMPAMTMAYAVHEPAKTLDAFIPGDTITAHLVVHGNDIYLTTIEKVGHAPLPANARPAKIMDVMAPGDRVPDQPLIDQNGVARKLSDWRGQALAVTFVYTRCPLPDFCPLMDHHFAALQQAIDHDPHLRGHVHLASITFDPAHDTPEVIAAHAKARGADGRTWSYLTGTPQNIDALGERFGLSAYQETDQSFTHNLRTAIIDPRGTLVTIHTGNDWTVEDVLGELRAARDR